MFRIIFSIFVLISFPAYSYTPPQIQDVLTDSRRLLQSPPSSLQKETALGCLAVAIYHESRGEPLDGQRAVASVILTRSLSPRWPSHPCEVVRQPYQFSFMTSHVDFPKINRGGAWTTAVKISAESLMTGPLSSLKGSDHYHADYVSPSWSKSMTLIEKRGLHLFFRSSF